LVYKASRLYYEDDLTFTEIGKKLKLSRFQVANIIKTAKEIGLVRIIIDEKFIDKNLKTATLLEDIFKIDKVLVVNNENLPESEVKRKIGLEAANLLVNIIKDNDVISLTTSSTVKAIADSIYNIGKIKNIKIIEANGGSNLSYSNSVHNISRKFSKVFNAPHFTINAPIIVDSIETKRVLLGEKNIKNTYKMFHEINILIFGIGTFYPKINKLMIESGDLHKNEFLELKRLYAAGNILFYYFDIEGNFLNTSFDNRIICLPKENIKDISYKVAAVFGHEKKYGVLGALRTGLINFLILDNVLAEKILEIKDLSQKEFKKKCGEDINFNDYINQMML